MADRRIRERKCGHANRRPMTGCAATDLETGESFWKCLDCGKQGTTGELAADDVTCDYDEEDDDG